MRADCSCGGPATLPGTLWLLDCTEILPSVTLLGARNVENVVEELIEAVGAWDGLMTELQNRIKSDHMRAAEVRGHREHYKLRCNHSSQDAAYTLPRCHF